MPGSETEPGPGRKAEPSMRPFPVAGMQKTEASVDGWAAMSVRLPAGDPVWVMAVQTLFESAALVPKQPGVVVASVSCIGQKMPFAAVLVTVPVESGSSVTANCGRYGPGGGQ